MIVKVKAVNGFKKTDGCFNASDKIVDELKSEDNKIENNEIAEIICDKNNIEEQEKKIYESCKNFFEKNQEKVFFVGGDHSLSYASVQAFFDYCKKQEKNPYLVIFDAHADCMEPEKNPSHESWLRAIIEKGFPEKNILLIGARNIYQEEKEFFEKSNIWKISCEEIFIDIENTADFITEFLNKENSLVYVSIDIDVLDPAFAPATTYLEPVGLTSQQFFYLAKRISRLNNIKALDIVEVDIIKDEKYNFITSKLAARIIEIFLKIK